MSQETYKIPDLDKLFALPSLLKVVKRILSGQPGIVAVTGQRGSGKDTTLYALALEASRLGLPISILTDERERQEFAGSYELPKEWRIHYFDGSKNSWSQAIDQVSENQPVAIVNKLTDDDFALRIGVDQASKGRWFFTVLGTPFIGIDVAYYLRECGLTNRQILDSFVGIVSQILIPRLCRDCARKVRADVEDARLIYPNADDLRKEVRREAGCLICQNRGTKGRCGAQEVLLIDDEVRSILDRYLEKHTLEKLPSSKHIPLQTSIRELVKEGTVGIETYKRLVFQNPLLRAYNQIEALEVAAREAKLRVQLAELRAQVIEKELQTAHELQMGMMSHEKPQIKGFDMMGRCDPANHVGGDFFKYFTLSNGRVAGVLADVTGHAMEAAVPMLMFSGILESQMELGGTVEDLFSRLNRSLYRTLPGRTFVCLQMGELDLSDRRMRLSNSGCPYPYHYRASTGRVTEVQIDAYPLGIRLDTEYPAVEVQLEAGDRVVFCSDGIAEAVNAAGEQFGYERTAGVIREACQEGLSAEATIDRLLKEVEAFRGDASQSDDITCVVVRVEE